MFSRKSMLNVFLSLALSGVSLQAQDMVTVYPAEYTEALSNPLKGFRPGNTFWSQYKYPTVVRDYIRWNEIENDASDGVDKIIDFCNANWAGFPEANIKVVPRVYIDWDDTPGNEYWPADLETGDWYSQEFKDRVVNLIYKLGQAWDNDPRVAWVQTGIIGYWGEQENPVGVDDNDNEFVKIMGAAFEDAFPNKLLVVRNQNYWDAEGYEWGVYWDSYAHPGQANGSWTRIRNANAQGRYLTHPVEGEVAYNWGYDVLWPVLGKDEDETLSTPQYYNYLIDVIRELHCSALGWVASYNPNDPNNITGAIEVQKAFGYRFVINEFSCSARANQGGTIDINFKVQNVGSAPFYENWPLAFVLIDSATQQIVWTETIPDIDIRTWHPGDDYNYNSRVYDTPAVEHEINASVTVPDILSGQYLAGLTILEPYSRTPGVFFAVKNFLAESQSQPLARIGIGADVVGGYEPDSTLFDDPVLDNNRGYTLQWNGPTYMLTTSAGTGGSVTPGSDTYPENHNVRLRATAQLGYEFSGWSGDLTGTDNPVTITMDSDKSITANFVSVPTYTLTINSANGSISLNPPGGTYNEGTEVRLTVNPDLGYLFSEWSGDLSGTDNPATITMDANKNVTANFTSAAIYTLTTNAEGGSIVLDPPGPQYTVGTVVEVEAIADVDYVFIGWSGDPLDYPSYINPNFITMDADKNITANFNGPPDQTGLWVETFNLPDGTTIDTGATAWTATRSSGRFEVFDNRFVINDAGPEGLFTTEKIDISGGSVDVSVHVEGAGGLDPQNSENEDYFGFFIQVDGGAEQLVYENYGTQSALTVSETAISGNTLVLLIKGYTTASDEFYYFDNLKVTTDEASSIDEKDRGLPQSTRLMQSYPNPFNPETTIPYQLSKASHVKLEIYNLLGQRMATLVNEQQSAGFYSVKWSAIDNNGSQMASGIYLYRLKTNDSVDIKKFVLVQ